MVIGHRVAALPHCRVAASCVQEPLRCGAEQHFFLQDSFVSCKNVSVEHNFIDIWASYCIMTFFGHFGLGAGAALLRKGAQFGAGLFRRNYFEEHEGKTTIYKAIGNKWQIFETVEKRPLESVVLENGISERIADDCWNFINNPSWYSERGISPKRRGYLLHGPLGCGKTSYITALAGELKRDICVFNLSESGLTNERLDDLLAAAWWQKIVLFEDIDAVFTSKYSRFKKVNSVTFSGLLKCLDCVASTEARILFMTSNYRYSDTLEPALLRTGKADVVEYIGFCIASQVEQMFLRFYKESPLRKDFCKLAKEFADSVMYNKRVVSPQDIQEYLMFYKSDPDAAVKNVTRENVTRENITLDDVINQKVNDIIRNV